MYGIGFASVGKFRIPKSVRFYSGLRYQRILITTTLRAMFLEVALEFLMHNPSFLINQNPSHGYPIACIGNHCVSVPSPSIYSSHFDSIKSPVFKLFASVAIDACQQPRDKTELMLQSRDSVTPNSFNFM